MRFVSPETVRITLPESFEDVVVDVANDDGSVTKATKRKRIENWIDVKKELSVGEDRRFRAAGFRRVNQSQEIDVDWASMPFAQVEAYLVDWSARDAKDKPVPVSRGALEALSSEDFETISAAIQKHIAEVASEKKRASGTPTSTVA